MKRKKKLIAYNKKVEPEKVLPLIFAGVRRNTPVYNNVKGIVKDELIDDIIFSKITANYKTLHEQYGEGFKLAYQAYKKGKGAKTRNEIAKYVKKQKAIDKKKKEPVNPQPNNPYMKFDNGVWMDYSPKALADRIRAMRDKSMAALKPLADMTAGIQKFNDSVNKINIKPKPLNTYFPAMEKKFNPFDFSKNNTILGSGLLDVKNLRIPRIKPTGSSRPAITGTGLTSYMERHKLKNPVDFAKAFKTKKGKDYQIKGFENLRFLCEQMNVTVEEALLYICEGMTSKKSRWRNHRLDKEYWRGSQSVINLVEYFDEKIAVAKKKKQIVYTVKALWNDSYTKALFMEYDVDRGSYSEFSRWFKKMQHHVYAYKKAKQSQKKH